MSPETRVLFQQYAMTFVGLPYHWGGENPMSGYDCSGLGQELMSFLGLDPVGDQSAQALYDHYVKTGTVGKRGCAALVFYGKSTSEVTHVTVMLTDWLCIGANGGNSTTLNETVAAKMNAFIKVRPYNYRRDVVAIVMPQFIGVA